MVGYSSRVLMEEELAKIERGEGLMEERENSLEHNGREREKEQGRRQWKVGLSNGNKIWVEFGFEFALNPKTAHQLFSNLVWDPHKN